MFYLLCLICFTGMAQRADHNHRQQEMFKELSVAQIATLKTKRLTIALLLNPQQQEKMQDLIENEVRFKKETIRKRAETTLAKPLTALERFERENTKLERQIAFQNNMQQLLTPEQFTKWQKMQALHFGRRHKKSKNNS